MNLEALKAAKKKTGLTIAEIAQRANLPKGTVQNIFCGYGPNPRSDTLEAIKRALGLSEEGYRDTLPFEVTPIEEEMGGKRHDRQNAYARFVRAHGRGGRKEKTPRRTGRS